MKRQVVAAACVLVILVSFTIVILRLRGGRGSVNMQPYIAVGEVLAEETIKLLNDQGQIVVVTLDTEKTPAPSITAQFEAFSRTLKKKSHITIAAVERIRPEDTTKPLCWTGENYLGLISRHAGAAAIVSLVAAPVLTDADRRQLPAKLPRCLVYYGGDPQVHLKKLFRDDIVQVAVVNRFTPAAAKAPPPRTKEEMFNRYYQIVTPATAASLPY